MGGRRRIQIDLALVRARLAEGVSVRAIADEIGVSNSALRRRMVDEGILLSNPNRVSDAEIERLRALAAQGLPRRVIAERLGLNLNTLQWRITRFGILVRKESSGVRYCAPAPAVETASGCADTPLPSLAKPVRLKPARVEPPKPAEPSPLDRELAGTGGSYAALALVAARHGMTSTQARARWHKLGLSVTVVK